MSLKNNPLLGHKGLPQFDKIETKHVVPAVKQVVKEATEKIEALEKNYEATWDGLIKPLNEIEESIHYTFSPVAHLVSVKSSDELRKAYEEVLGDIVAIGLRVGQSEKIYEGYVAIKNSKAWSDFDDAQKRIIEKAIHSAKLSGIDLKGAEKERYNEISKELSNLSTQFSNNVLDATKEFSLVLKSKEDIVELPDSFLALASSNYKKENKDAAEVTAESGPWLVTLDIPSFLPFMKYSPRRDLKEQVYKAYVTKASSGKLDNSENISKILKLRKEKAELLGYKNYAEVSLSEKMAASVDDILDLENDLLKAAVPKSKKEFSELQDFAKENGADYDLSHWDIAYWSRRLREAKYNYTDEELKPYFSLPRILDGMFDVAHVLFNVNIKPHEGYVERWHEDVKFYDIFNSENKHIASFYLDPYSRPENKRGGAWMNNAIDRSSKDGEVTLPVAYLVCNFTPAIKDTPSLLTFNEVTTMFHEFGHGLQHMLTAVDYSEVSGVNGVEWDAVELPSQFMENWCYHKATLMNMAKHYETGESLPEDLFNKIIEAKNFQAAMGILRQINFGMLDLYLHSEYDPNGSETVFDIQRKFEEMTAVLPPYPKNRFLCAFGHIFAGGYAAGYYSYLWAEVLSADAFGAFEEAGLDNKEKLRETGERFKNTILALGGSRHPMDVFKEFRGREPQTDALMRDRGLKA